MGVFRKVDMKRWYQTVALGLGILALTACAIKFPPMPVMTTSQDEIRGAFSSSDKLYLIGRVRDYELPIAPFDRYKQLADSHLRGNIVCAKITTARLYATAEKPNEFNATYSVLLKGKNVTPADIETYKLKRLDIDTTDSVVEPNVWYKLTDGGCPQLSHVKKESFYIAYFSAQGRSQFLRNREQALNQSRLPQPLPMTVEKYVDPLLNARNNSVADSAEVAVKAPFYLLGIMFGGV